MYSISPNAWPTADPPLMFTCDYDRDRDYGYESTWTATQSSVALTICSFSHK